MKSILKMKTIFNGDNRGKATLYILFGVVLLLFPLLLYMNLPLLAFIDLLCFIVLGSLIIQVRSDPPW